MSQLLIYPLWICTTKMCPWAWVQRVIESTYTLRLYKNYPHPVFVFVFVKTARLTKYVMNNKISHEILGEWVIIDHSSYINYNIYSTIVVLLILLLTSFILYFFFLLFGFFFSLSPLQLDAHSLPELECFLPVPICQVFKSSPFIWVSYELVQLIDSENLLIKFRLLL